MGQGTVLFGFISAIAAGVLLNDCFVVNLFRSSPGAGLPDRNPD